MKLYKRDFLKGPNKEEITKYKEICEKEKEGMIMGKINLYREYPEAVRHYISLFPNNHIDLFDWQSTGKMKELTAEFTEIVHSDNDGERQILNFVNHKPAYYIIGSLLSHYDFGHHETYIFPEFPIGYKEDGKPKYFADYLIVGKNSGGYEFLFVKLEAPNKRTTIKNGYEGENTRKGLIQTYNWKHEIEANFESITNEFNKCCSNIDKLPNEFKKYDSSRMHFMVICGLRDDYKENTYRERRDKFKNEGVDMRHYDNLIDQAKELEEKNTF